MTHTYAPMGEWRIAYETHGEGEPAMVFIHGASSNRTIWRPLMTALGEPGRLIAIDRLGYGESDQPETTYTMDVFAESVAAVLDDANIGRAVLVGHSNGVPVARQLHRRWPERVGGLVLLDGMLTQGVPAAQLDWMRNALERPDYDDFMAGLVRRWPAAHLTPEQREELKAVALSVPKHVMLGEMYAIADGGNWKADPIDVPLLVIQGAGPSRTDAEREYVRSLNFDAVYEVLLDASHFFIVDRPEAVATRIREFLNE